MEKKLVGYVACGTCGKEVHAAYAHHNGGNCMKCVKAVTSVVAERVDLVSELNAMGGSFYKKAPVVRAGYVACGCGAQIPEVKVDEWGGKCPRCQGTKQEAKKRGATPNQFKSLEEYQASKR